MKYNTYLFDFDGTLVDSMPAFVSVMLRILDENNIKYEDDIVKIITPLGYKGTAEYFKKLGISLSIEEMLKTMNEYAYNEYAYNIQAKNNVVSVLEKLKNSGASLNILTASPHNVLDICLKRIGIYNLFDNAVKFTPDNGTIEFRLTEEKKQAVFSIKNTGKGISQEECGLIFDRFYKVDKSRGLDAKSFGMGLYIVKSIVELHGGTISVNSEVGEYTEFKIFIPIQ